MTQKATAYALANYFVLYLQDKGKLKAVYDTFRAQDATNLNNDSRDEDSKLLSLVMGESLEDIDQHFSQWFQTVR